MKNGIKATSPAARTEKPENSASAHLPGWKAAWIWTPEWPAAEDSWVLFRQAVDIPGKFRKAVLRATAGHFCHLFLNGREIGRGPDRCYFRRKIFHEYDLSNLLRPGRNILAAEVHFVGEYLPGCVERHAHGPAGFLAQLEVDGKPVAWTGADWRAMPNPARLRSGERISLHREWKNDFAAGREIPGWKGISFDDSAWERAAVVAPAEGGPWERLVRKETPELTARTLRPLNMYCTSPGGFRPPGYEPWLFYNPVTAGAPRYEGVLKIDNCSQERQELLFDMGRVVSGYPRIEIADCSGGTIRVYYGDSLDLFHADTIRLGRGPLTWTPFTLRGGRYFRLEITGAENPVALRSVRWVKRNYPARYAGAFECSEARLGRTWDLCALTAETCAQEHMTDCVHREQVLWMMDFRFQAPQHAYFFGDTALAARCFRQFAEIQLENGHLVGYGPSCRPLEHMVAEPAGPLDRKPNDWFGFNFFYLVAAAEHYRHTGDASFARELLPACLRCLDYHEKAEQDGFAAPGEIPGQLFVEWGYDVRFEGLSAYHQALYHGALKSCRELAEAAGEVARARKLERKAADLESRFFVAFADPRTGLIASELVGGRRVFHGRVHPAAAALLFFDRFPAGVLRANLERIEKRADRVPKSGLGISLVAEALFRHGRGAAALALIGDYYGAILEAGLPQVPEVYDMAGPPGADSRYSPAYSRCHSYASLAGVLLQREVLGVSVSGNKVTLSPFVDTLEKASGRVPTARGTVSVSWRRSGGETIVTARVPKGLDLKIAPRGNGPKVLFRVRRF